MPKDRQIATGPFDPSGRPAAVPARASEPGADHNFAGERGRIIVPAQAKLPELAAAGDDVDRFDPDTMTGEVTAYPSIIGRPYRMGWFTWHQLEPGCFDESIAEQDGRFPIYVQHNWDWSERPPIGNVNAAREVDFDDAEDDGARALEIVGRLYPDIPDGLACLHAMAARALREWSIGYLIEAYRVEEDDDEGRLTVYVERAQLWEASVVLRGANPWTQTLEVASRPDVAGTGGLDALIAAEVARQLEAMPPASPAEPTPAEISEDPWAELATSSPSFRAALARSAQ